jgi:hypothetical protein
MDEAKRTFTVIITVPKGWFWPAAHFQDRGRGCKQLGRSNVLGVGVGEVWGSELGRSGPVGRGDGRKSCFARWWGTKQKSFGDYVVFVSISSLPLSFLPFKNFLFCQNKPQIEDCLGEDVRSAGHPAGSSPASSPHPLCLPPLTKLRWRAPHFTSHH